MKCFGFVKKTRSVGVREQKSTAAARPIPCHGTGSGENQSYSGDELKTQHATTSKCRSIASLYEEKADNLRVFDITELRNATNNFSRLLKIGEGGFGSVYRGFMRLSPGEATRTTVAIKKLKAGSLQGHKQWLTEIQFLGVADHPSLVRLIGYCSLDSERGIERLLVYEFMPNKSLEDHLFNRACPVLSWETRLKIALSVAKGLSYLHEGLEVQVIYRDFKASNVLLDKDFNPKLSDFGLARQGPSDGRTHVTTAVVGTYGYACPDYIQTGHLTIKSDVWSFGVVLFEILTGRRCLDRMRPKSEQKLLEWVKQYPVESKTFRMIMDPRLGNNYSISTARLVANLANTCLGKNRKERPSMSQVVESLQLAISS